MNSEYVFPYPSKRFPLFSEHGAVCTSQQLAAQAGLDTLKKGGNAIDAAITVASCLCVLEPQSNGMGGDAFAIISTPDYKLVGLNSSGRSAALADPDKLLSMGFKTMPDRGVHSVTVPGIPGAWAALSERFGRLSFETCLAAAIDYAENGFIMTPVMRHALERSYNTFSELANNGQSEYASWIDLFVPDGKLPEIGQKITRPLHAQSLKDIAKSKAREFYEGSIAEKAESFFVKYGGSLRKSDFAAFKADWVSPLSAKYRDYRIWELPPNGQGLVCLMALNILNGFSFEKKDSAETWHKTIEAVKLAFADGLEFITDPDCMRVSPEDLLSEGYAEDRRRLITDKALTPFTGKPQSSGTVYLCAADGEGNMISYIQSNFGGFGSGLAIPGTGVALQNRGASFTLDKTRANCLAPGKRPYHTIIPAFITRADGTPVGPFGVMGGHMQPQGHTQVAMNLIDFGMNPQAALDCPRFRWNGGLKINIEDFTGEELISKLAEMGHELNVIPRSSDFGHGQIIRRIGDGLESATEPRIDGAAIGW